MGKIAFVFAGQGAQYSGMGKSLYECDENVKSLYDMCEEIRPNTKNQSFEGTLEELKITSNTQPCLYLVDLAAALALNSNGIFADGVAGFSLGEIPALAYANAYSNEDGFKIVMERGNLMQKAASESETAMAAVMKVSSKVVEEVCEKFDKVYPVNYNSPIQTVVSGDKNQLEEFKIAMKEFTSRIIDLPVSGAFHSPYMQSASDGFLEKLENFDIKKPEIPVYSNLTASVYGEDVKNYLVKQIISPVKWQTIIENMVADGFTTFIEVGAGKTLSGLIKKINSDVVVYNVCDKDTLDATIEAVKSNA